MVGVRTATAAARRRLYVEASTLVARDYRRELTLQLLSVSLAASPRQIQRAYAEFGGTSFREDLRGRRLEAAAELLREQPSISIAQIARLVGYGQAPHFARAFRVRYGRTPGEFRARGRRGAGQLERSPAGRPALAAAPFDDAIAESPTPSSCSVGAGSSPGSRRRITVPPPGACSALIAPPC